mgnify:CR=1 FL=1
MAKRQPLTCVCNIYLENGSLVPLDGLAKGDFETIRKKWSERLSINMTDYYNQHPDELIALFAHNNEAGKNL